MPAWADILGLSLESPEDEEGTMATRNLIHSLIADEMKAGVAANRIVVGGFSQGAAMACVRPGTRPPTGCARSSHSASAAGCTTRATAIRTSSRWRTAAATRTSFACPRSRSCCSSRGRNHSSTLFVLSRTHHQVRRYFLAPASSVLTHLAAPDAILQGHCMVQARSQQTLLISPKGTQEAPRSQSRIHGGRHRKL